MDETLERIIERPALLEWLVSGDWEEHFDHESLVAGQEDAHEKAVREVVWMDLDGAGELTVTATVRSGRSKTNELSIVFSESRKRWSLESDCSCPVIHECRHAASTLQFICEHLPAELVPPRMIQGELPLMSAAPISSTEDDDDEPTAETGSFLAYCIEQPHSTVPKPHQFVIRMAKRLSRGRVRITSGVASVNPDKPTFPMVEEDIELVRWFQKRQFTQQTFGPMPMEGAGWEEILTRALATGRVYFGAEVQQHRGTTDHQPLSAGKTERVEAYWETLVDGSARPMVRTDRPGLEFFPIDPPYYFDEKNVVLGRVESNLPASVLATWTRGPVIKPENIPSVIERLSRYPGATLPKPRLPETVTRPAEAPRPVLWIRKVSFGPSWERIDRFIGELMFEYGDSPRLQPLTSSAPRQHVAQIDGKRVVWPRDFRAERIAEAELLRSPLVPFAKPPNPNALVPKHDLPSHEMAWLNLLQGDAFTELRKNGWLIAVDPRAGLVARDASSFIPAIETDSDHGIDWFRFDISYEIDGQRFSLIPFIAQAIAKDFPPADSPDLPEHLLLPCENPEDGFIRLPAKQLMETVDRVRHLFIGNPASGKLRLDRLSAASVADMLEIDGTETARTLAQLGAGLRDIHELPAAEVPTTVRADLRGYQKEGYRWLQFLASQGLHGILADDMGLGKTLQTLTHLAAEHAKRPGKPSLIVAPTSVVPNWYAEANRFVPELKILTLHGPNRHDEFDAIPDADIVLTSYPLLGRDIDELASHQWHVVVLDEAQHIKNPKSINARSACKLKAAQRICLSGTPMENHLGELWSLMRFLMPGFLGDEKTFNTRFRKPIENEHSTDAQQALNLRVAPLILRRTKDQVASELPPKTELIHHIDLNKDQTRLYESIRASMDKRVRDAISEKGLGRSHIIALDALMKLRQICCHPMLLKGNTLPAPSAKLDFLTEELLPTLLEEGRRILLFSQFTSMLALIQEHLERAKIPFLKLTGQTKNRGEMVETFQKGNVPIFLISLKAGGTGLNLTAADTIIHYDPWWNPAAENQATDRAHRIGQTKPVFVHKLICQGSIEDRILDLQKHKSDLVESLLSAETSQLKLDPQTLSHLLAPME